MKVVINRCFGGFGLSPRAIKRLAELNGRECYFYKDGISRPFEAMSIEDAFDSNSLFMSAFDVPNINDILPDDKLGDDGTYKGYNEAYRKHSLNYSHDIDRTDPKLIQVIEEMGAGHRTGASGACSELAIVEIPDGIEWEIDEYDGNETISEKHRTWR